jgi:hypothetical protein
MVFMAKQTVQPRKKRGPPATGKGEPVQVRLRPDQIAALDVWISEQDDAPTRPEAIRRLFEGGLKAAQPKRAHPSQPRDVVIDAPDEPTSLWPMPSEQPLGRGRKSTPRPSPTAASKASDLAAQQIDKLVDPSIPAEERQMRKRRLLKGPKEFRDIRDDLPKPKG